MKKKIIRILLVILILNRSFCFSQPGSLDQTFSGDGKVTAGFMLPSVITKDFAYSTAIQADGKIVAAGYSVNGTSFDFSIVRYNATGTLDNTFNLNGKVSLDFGGKSDVARAVTIQADGKIVVAGYSGNGPNDDFAVARFNADGTPDNSFSGDGKLTTAMVSGLDRAFSAAIQTDGKIVVAGYAYNGSNNDFAVARYNTDGTLDNTFDGDGKVITDFSNFAFHFDEYGRSVAIQADGKIVIAGNSNNGSIYSFTAVRYNMNGSIDNTFSGDGEIRTTIGINTDEAYSIVIQKDGKMVLAGDSYNGSDYDFALVRYNTDGTPDNTFSGDGKLTTKIGTGNDNANSVAIQADGKIVAAGSYYNGSNTDFALVRYSSDGTPDNTFSGDGKVTTTIGTSTDAASSVVIQGNGRIVAVGSFNNGANDDFALVRYNTDGTLDNSCATDGKLITDIGATEIAAIDNSFAVAVKSNGKIVVAGTSSLSGSNFKSDLAIAQYKPNGKLDKNFGFEGEVLGEFEGGNFVVHTSAIQSDGKIIVGGYFDHGKRDFALARYNANGTLDNTFGQDGFVTTMVSVLGWDNCQSIIVQPDGKILAAGLSQSCVPSCTSDFALVRYNADGTLDNFFSLDGILTTDFTSSTDVINSVALQPDGKIVVAGYSYNGSNYDIAVARYKANGDPDNTFSGDGKQTTDFSTNDDYGQCVKIQTDGKIVVGGYSGKTSVKDNDFGLVRYKTDGTLDNTFSGDGKLLTTINGTSADYCLSLQLESNGNIIAGGYYINTQAQADFALVRYKTDGTPDNTFGNGGKIATDFANSNDFGTAMAIGADGKLVMAGNSNNDFAVARYNLTAVAFTNMAAVKQEIKSVAVEVLPNNILRAIISPNPVHNNTTLQLFNAKKADVILSDNNGKVLWQKHNTNTTQVQISMQQFAAGIYFIKVVSDNQTQTLKLVKE